MTVPVSGVGLVCEFELTGCCSKFSSPFLSKPLPNLNHGQDTRANRTRQTTRSSTQASWIPSDFIVPNVYVSVPSIWDSPWRPYSSSSKGTSAKLNISIFTHSRNESFQGAVMDARSQMDHGPAHKVRQFKIYTRHEERDADHHAGLTNGSMTTVVVVVDRGLASDLASLASPEREKGQPAL